MGSRQCEQSLHRSQAGTSQRSCPARYPRPSGSLTKDLRPGEQIKVAHPTKSGGRSCSGAAFFFFFKKWPEKNVLVEKSTKCSYLCGKGAAHTATLLVRGRSVCAPGGWEGQERHHLTRAWDVFRGMGRQGIMGRPGSIWVKRECEERYFSQSVPHRVWHLPVIIHGRVGGSCRNWRWIGLSPRKPECTRPKERQETLT